MCRSTGLSLFRKKNWIKSRRQRVKTDVTHNIYSWAPLVQRSKMSTQNRRWKCCLSRHSIEGFIFITFRELFSLQHGSLDLVRTTMDHLQCKFICFLSTVVLIEYSYMEQLNRLHAAEHISNSDGFDQFKKWQKEIKKSTYYYWKTKKEHHWKISYFISVVTSKSPKLTKTCVCLYVCVFGKGLYRPYCTHTLDIKWVYIGELAIVLPLISCLTFSGSINSLDHVTYRSLSEARVVIEIFVLLAHRGFQFSRYSAIILIRGSVGRLWCRKNNHWSARDIFIQWTPFRV